MYLVKYPRSKQLWDALATNRLPSPSIASEAHHAVRHGTPASRHTIDALIEFGMQGTSLLFNIRQRMVEARPALSTRPISRMKGSDLNRSRKVDRAPAKPTCVVMWQPITK
jgi:hypothetical protein